MVTRMGDQEIGVISGRLLIIQESWHVQYAVSFVLSFSTLYPKSDQKMAQLASKRQNS